MFHTAALRALRVSHQRVWGFLEFIILKVWRQTSGRRVLMINKISVNHETGNHMIIKTGQTLLQEVKGKKQENVGEKFSIRKEFPPFVLPLFPFSSFL